MNELNNVSNAINSLNSTDLIRIILYGEKILTMLLISK